MAEGFIQSNLRAAFAKSLDKFEEDVRNKILMSGVAAMAKVIYTHAQFNVSGARSHPKVLTGNLRDSILRAYSERSSTDYKKTYRVTWDIKKAPHGHLIEFGTSRSPAYPFMRPAFDHIDEAIRAGNERMRERMKEVGS